MAEDITVPENINRKTLYEGLIPQMEALVKGEDDVIASLANIMAVLKQGLQFFWVGCYFVKGDELVLGPFQGTPACTRIAYGKGVCGTSWKEQKTLIVDEVDQFPGHIACSALSKSEIVLPAFDKNGKVVLILDIDSDQKADFDQTDQKYLEQVVKLIEEKLN